MSDFKFVLNRAGVRELMQSQEMQDVLVEFAGQVAERADEAAADNLDHNTLEKAIR